MRTILLVEDDTAVRKVLRHMLNTLGYRTLEAGSAPDALRAIRAHTEPIELMITDVVMPQTNCDRFVGQIQAERPGLKVIYISGYTSDVLTDHGVEDSNVNFIQKPFTAEKLRQKIREILGENTRCAAGCDRS